MPTAGDHARIARLRSYVAVFARGGELGAAAEALSSLSRAEREAGQEGEALKRARQAAAIAEMSGGPGERARSLVHLAALMLERGEPEAAAEAAAIAAQAASGIEEAADRQATAGTAGLVEGMARRGAGDLAAARVKLDEARELLVAADQPEAAALALGELGLVDLDEGEPACAELCFGFARDFCRAADLAGSAAHLAATAARAFAERDAEPAERWFGEAVQAAELAGDRRLAALLAWDRTDWLERAGRRAEARRAAGEAARRLAELGTDVAAQALAVHARLALSRLTDEAGEAQRHLEAAFDLGLAGSDEAALRAALDQAVGALVDGRFPKGAWRHVERFQRDLERAGWQDLAEAAAQALAELR